MASTAPLPDDVFYLSERLVTTTYQSESASDDRWAVEGVTAGVGPFGAEFKAPGDQLSNPYWLATRVTERVSARTGSLEEPDRYVRTKLIGYWAEAPCMVDFETTSRVEVAWLAAVMATEAGPVFVQLCGSVGNYVDRVTEPYTYRGWYPSSPMGLRHIVHSFTEGRDDPEAAQRRPPRVSAMELTADAYHISAGLSPAWQVGAGEFDVLFRVFECVDDVAVAHRGIRLRRALIGTPLWAASTTMVDPGFEWLTLPETGDELALYNPPEPIQVEDDRPPAGRRLRLRRAKPQVALPAPTALEWWDLGSAGKGVIYREGEMVVWSVTAYPPSRHHATAVSELGRPLQSVVAHFDVEPDGQLQLLAPREDVHRREVHDFIAEQDPRLKPDDRRPRPGW